MKNTLIKLLGCVGVAVTLASCGGKQHTHDLVHHDAVASTCIEAGTVEYWSCNGCSKLFLDEAATQETDDLVAPLAAHALTHISAKNASCTEEGNVEYWHCEVCAKNFSDEEGKTEASVTVIDKLAHSIEHVAAVPSDSCLHTGTIEYWKCNDCDQKFGDAEGKRVITDIDDKTYGAHSLNHHEAVAPTCEAAGNYEYWDCSVCSKVYSDSAATQETSLAAVTRSSIGHSMSSEWSKSATEHWHACGNTGCEHVEDRGNHSFGDYAVDENNNVYRDCSVCGKYVLGQATAISFAKDYSSNDGFHYSIPEGTLPFAQGTLLNIINKDAIETNVSNIDKITVRNSTIVSFYNLSLSAGSFICINGNLLVENNGQYYSLEMPGQYRTSLNTTVAITGNISEVKAFREYNNHMMVDINCSDLGYGTGATHMSWTVAGTRFSKWSITLTRDGSTSDISNYNTTNGGFTSGKELLDIYFQGGSSTYLRFDFDKTKLEVGDIITIKAGTAFCSTGADSTYIFDKDISFVFDGSFVSFPMECNGEALEMNHWADNIGHVSFSEINLLQPYEANTAYALASVKGVSYKANGGEATEATLTGRYMNRSEGFRGLILDSISGVSYASGDKIIFSDGFSFMIAIDNQSNYYGRLTVKKGFTLEYNGTQWNLAA